MSFGAIWYSWLCVEFVLTVLRRLKEVQTTSLSLHDSNRNYTILFDWSFQFILTLMINKIPKTSYKGPSIRSWYTILIPDPDRDPIIKSKYMIPIYFIGKWSCLNWIEIWIVYQDRSCAVCLGDSYRYQDISFIFHMIWKVINHY